MIAQLMILMTGIPAVVLAQTGSPKYAKWGPILGLIGQPFWLYSTWTAGQWGMFINAILYTMAWGYGFWRYWIED